MRNPRRDRLEYLLYATIMTSTTIALGLGIVFGFDEQGKRRTPVMDQPLEESWREAKQEMVEYRVHKQLQFKQWMVRHGHASWYDAIVGSNGSTASASASNHSQQQQQQVLEPQAPRRPPTYLEAAAAEDSKNEGNKSNQRWWA